MAVTIHIADRFPALRRGIRAWLEDRPGYQVVGEAGDGPETLRVVKQLQPTVLVIDVKMPGLDGLDVLRATRKVSANTRGVVYSHLSHQEKVVEALRMGALA